MTAVVCVLPAYRLSDSRLNVDPRLNAVEEILQLRHDIDDHALAVTLLRGHRPDLDALAIEGAITELLELAAEVGHYGAAVDVYEAQLREFVGGAR